MKFIGAKNIETERLLLMVPTMKELEKKLLLIWMKMASI